MSCDICIILDFVSMLVVAMLSFCNESYGHVITSEVSLNTRQSLNTEVSSALRVINLKLNSLLEFNIRLNLKDSN